MATVKDILNRKGNHVLSVTGDKTALAAAKIMDERNVGALVVMQGQTMIGILSERDILRRVVAAGLDPEKAKVFEIMTTPVAFCQPNTKIEECQVIITNRRIRHLPVLENGELKGMVTIGDILAMEVEEQGDTIKYLNEYILVTPAVNNQ